MRVLALDVMNSSAWWVWHRGGEGGSAYVKTLRVVFIPTTHITYSEENWVWVLCGEGTTGRVVKYMSGLW
jgi:hypothetical protein